MDIAYQLVTKGKTLFCNVMRDMLRKDDNHIIEVLSMCNQRFCFGFPKQPDKLKCTTANDK
ncbi:hypothetical protein OUZ56_002825 [Daphnia magna]|uniref:Uncharacterized protein n=1 Tax=Daphnia magna TaxID=35525 RepID=A0ABR0A6V9_9CRUS|nr:hypothetical protein OUZ56_002825 [Daphnia magna]